MQSVSDNQGLRQGDKKMARMKFYCYAERCIECNACVTACKNEHEVPWGVNRRRVVTIKDGEQGERSLSVACMHCSDAPCADRDTTAVEDQRGESGLTSVTASCPRSDPDLHLE